MDWRNSNDDLTRQSDARRERENQRFENGITDRDRGGFGGMRQGLGGDPLARMRGAQPDPFANRVGGGMPQRPPFGQPQGFPQQNQPPQHLSQHEDWMDKIFKVVTGLWKHLSSYVWPVLSESDDMFKSDYKLRKGLTAALLYYGAVGGFSFVFGLFTRFATAPGIFISLVAGGISGGLFLYKNSQNKEQPMFILNMDYAKQILMRESKYVRRAVVIYLNQLEDKVKELEKQLTTKEQYLLNIMTSKSDIEIATNVAKFNIEYVQPLENNLKEEKDKVILKNLELKNQKHKVDLYDTIADKNKTFTMSEVAKLINYIGVGRNKLFEIFTAPVIKNVINAESVYLKSLHFFANAHNPFLIPLKLFVISISPFHSLSNF